MQNNPASAHIQAVAVNHNTSKYAELMLRSLFARHGDALDISVTILDNNSDDEFSDLVAYARQVNVPVLQSGFGRKTENNSHGQVLKNFVLAQPVCAYFLFLDADVCFLEADTLDTMLLQLRDDPTAFAIAPRLSYDQEQEIYPEYRDLIYHTRLHPCCALVKNTPTFRRVVELVGLGCYKNLLPDREEYLDTFHLMTAAMKTHGQHYLRSSKLVQHFFSVSYEWDPPEVLQSKILRRDNLLAQYRQVEAS